MGALLHLPGTWRRLAVLAFVFAALGPSAFALPASGQEPPVTEYQLKTAFLYNFAKFVDWPSAAFDAADSDFRLCILGEEPFVTARASLAGKRVKGRPVTVARVAAADEAQSCHMLFVGAADSARVAPTLAALGPHVLTVGESADFTHHGGFINLVRIDNKIRFEIDRTAGERSGLKFSAQLLKLAILVDHGR